MSLTASSQPRTINAATVSVRTFNDTVSGVLVVMRGKTNVAGHPTVLSNMEPRSEGNNANKF